MATAVISGIAAWVSYWHMAGVAARYGETGSSAYLLPISVDGLIVVSSICLVELAGHLHESERTPTEAIPATGAAATGIRQRGVVDEHEVDEPGEDDWPHESDADGSDAVRVLDPALIATARQVARQHQASTGREITRDQLRAALRTSNATAGALLRQLHQEEPAGVANGRRAIEAGLFGEVTR